MDIMDKVEQKLQKEEDYSHTDTRNPPVILEERIEEIHERVKGTSPGPWSVWDGPEYCGGGKDLCIGSGEDWLANMDHRHGPDWNERVEHCSGINYFGEDHDGTTCTICSIDVEVTREQRANADFIAHARSDIPFLLDRVKLLEFILADGSRLANILLEMDEQNKADNEVVVTFDAVELARKILYNKKQIEAQ